MLYSQLKKEALNGNVSRVESVKETENGHQVNVYFRYGKIEQIFLIASQWRQIKLLVSNPSLYG